MPLVKLGPHAMRNCAETKTRYVPVEQAKYGSTVNWKERQKYLAYGCQDSGEQPLVHGKAHHEAAMDLIAHRLESVGKCTWCLCRVIQQLVWE